MLATVSKMLALWNYELFPLTQAKVIALGATLKAGRYRSGAMYLSKARAECERLGQNIGSAIVRTIKDTIRSCERGLGPARKTCGLPMNRLRELPDGDDPWSPGGPMAPKRTLIAGAWWLTREIELSTARASLVSIWGSSGSRKVSWCLPASKTDTQAMGVERTHGCCCGNGCFGDICPVHTLELQRSTLKDWFPSQHLPNGGPNSDLPLFPNEDGSPCTKQAIVESIQKAAEFLGLPKVSADSLSLWSGHSLRVAGAQGLALVGLDTWIIQLLGRWGSSAVFGDSGTPLYWPRIAGRGRPAPSTLWWYKLGQKHGCLPRLSVSAIAAAIRSGKPRWTRRIASALN